MISINAQVPDISYEKEGCPRIYGGEFYCIGCNIRQNPTTGNTEKNCGSDLDPDTFTPCNTCVRVYLVDPPQIRFLLGNDVALQLGGQSVYSFYNYESGIKTFVTNLKVTEEIIDGMPATAFRYDPIILN
jgi:hypothetical protein